jgi:hypothetical protein
MVNMRPMAAACWHLVAALAVVTDVSCRLDDGQRGEWVVGEARQPVRQQVVHDAAQRRDALEVAAESAVAPRDRLVRLEQAVHRDVHVPELARHPRGATHDRAAFDDAAAQARPDDRGDGRSL